MFSRHFSQACSCGLHNGLVCFVGLGFPSLQYVLIQLRWKTGVALRFKPIGNASATGWMRNGD
ncbi:hypothetical protein MAMT_00103 [Methylacidimicrobium tartarophylax]|uniref:Uncharacterized protein n=1 Tax=Methylacidimicrobium tartarophylax TaxID=1041768 RepID=A0A5E6M7V6_9BACT|nr:hypothetical protein MAMT_00103 [Methylacidimicrobium tartarophylax]